jgi:NADPH-dependent 2,4-dienoyl-CoA reductase/sulfur reductase-like enzyme
MATTQATLDVLVIGAGQAGLALGHSLRETGLRFLLVDRHDRVGESWRRRFDSLTLFTPRAYSALPGLPVPGDPKGYPGKDEIADYLEAYAAHFALPVSLGTGIERLERQGEMFQATTSDGTVLTARTVVLASGAFQEPSVPAISRQLADGAGGGRRRDRSPDRPRAERNPSSGALHRTAAPGEPVPAARQERVLVDGQAGPPAEITRKPDRAKADAQGPLPR